MSYAAWTDEVLSWLVAMDAHLQRAAARGEQRSEDYPAELRGEPLAKFPARSFNYLDELDRPDEQQPATDQQLLEEVARFFRGAQRPGSPYCVFNLNVLPTAEATAAACLSVIQNVNGLMDDFAGEAMLVEQQVARTIGRWAGWPAAMGISCNGGKATMQYALRTAVARAQPTSMREGIRGRLVVLCSAGAHYSVEHVAAMVGLGAGNCIRVPLGSDGAMSMAALGQAMEDVHREGATIAAVVCCGGTTIDFCCDDTEAVCQLVDRFTRERRLSVRPYLHFDSVIGWLYLAFRDLPPDEYQAAVPDERARGRIVEVVRRCSALERFDSLGVDFHKTGLCPYSSSFFVGRNARFMDELGTGDYAYGPSDFEFGNFRAYRYTIENTRPTHGTLAAWVNLRRLARPGLRSYLTTLHRARAGVEAALDRHGEFAPLNDYSLGWEVVIDIPLGAGVAGDDYRRAAVAFMEHCWQRVLDGYEVPLFSIVPEYLVGHDASRSRAAFLIYPMRELTSDAWDAIVAGIARERRSFEAGGQPGRAQDAGGFAKPIR